jgi:ketosteroid isomerase-like protein
MTDATGAKNEDAVRRFFTNDFAGDERRNLWAEDALFETPFEPDGPNQIRGREAIMEESAEWADRIHDWRFYDVEVHPTVDSAVFWVTCKAESKDRNDKTWITDFVNYFRVVDGQVVHRKEYFDPSAHPR